MAAAHVLIADDDDDLRDLVRAQLERAGHRVTAARDGDEALKLLFGAQPDLVILDVSMPGRDGFEVLDRIRELTDDIPVMMLTAAATELEKVRGLRSGADDYVTKPFGRQELLARVEGLLRRSRGRAGGKAAAPQRHDDGLIDIDFAACEVRCAGCEVSLTPLELRVLTAFVRHPNQVLSRDQLRDIVWADELGGSRDQVKVYVGYVRRKLETAAGVSPIETVRGYGYRYSPRAASTA